MRYTTTSRGARLRRRGVYALACASLLGLTLSACGSGSSGASTSGSSSSTPSITVGGFDIAAGASLYYAEAKGYFTKVGLDVTVKDLTAAEFIPAVTSNQVDISFSSLPAVLLAAGKNLPVKMLFGQLATSPDNCPLTLLVPPNSSISSFKDLAGKTVAIDSQDSNEQLGLDPILKAEGVTGVKYLPTGQTGDPELAAMQKGTADAMVQTEPFSSSMVADGDAKLVSNLCVPPTPNPENASGYATSSSFLSSHSSEIKLFEEGMADATKAIKANPSAFDSWMATKFKVPLASVKAEHTGAFGVYDTKSSFTYLKSAMTGLNLPVSNVDINSVRVPLMVTGS